MKSACCSCQTTGSMNRTVSVMTRMSAPANAVSAPMNAMSMKSVGQVVPSTNAMASRNHVSDMNQMGSPYSQLMDETAAMVAINGSQMMYEQVEDPPHLSQVTPSKQISFMEHPTVSRISQNMSSTMSRPSSQILPNVSAVRTCSNMSSPSFQRQSSMRHQVVPPYYIMYTLPSCFYHRTSTLNRFRALRKNKQRFKTFGAPSYGDKDYPPPVTLYGKTPLENKAFYSSTSCPNLLPCNIPTIQYLPRCYSYCNFCKQPHGNVQQSKQLPQANPILQRIPSSTISCRTSQQGGGLSCGCGRSQCPADGHEESVIVPSMMSASGIGSMVEQPTRDCDGPCPCTGQGGGPSPSGMFSGGGGSALSGFRRSTSIFKVLPGGSYNNNDCKKPCNVVEPEAICLPCGHTFPEGPRDTTWRVKIMKDVGVQTTGFDHGIQTQTSETRIINSYKLESILPESERYLYEDESDLCSCKVESQKPPPQTSNCLIRRLASFGELERTKSGCQNNLRFTSDGCNNPPHIIEASTNTTPRNKTLHSSVNRNNNNNKKKCKNGCSIM